MDGRGSGEEVAGLRKMRCAAGRQDAQKKKQEDGIIWTTILGDAQAQDSRHIIAMSPNEHNPTLSGSWTRHLRPFSPHRGAGTEERSISSEGSEPARHVVSRSHFNNVLAEVRESDVAPRLVIGVWCLPGCPDPVFKFLPVAAGNAERNLSACFRGLLVLHTYHGGWFLGL